MHKYTPTVNKVILLTGGISQELLTYNLSQTRHLSICSPLDLRLP